MTHPTMPPVGSELPVLRRTITLTDMIAYAGSTWDWHRLHYDLDYLGRRGLAAPVVDGQFFGALLVAQAQDFFGSRAFVRSLHFRFANLVFAGDTVECAMRVTAAETRGRLVLATLAASVGVVGDDARVAVAPAGLEVELR